MEAKSFEVGRGQINKILIKVARPYKTLITFQGVMIIISGKLTVDF